MSIKRQQMVILRFEGKKLEDLDFWTKSDPYLTLSRPAKHGPGTVQVCKIPTTVHVMLLKIYFISQFCKVYGS